MRTTVHISGRLLWKWGRNKCGNYIAICDAFAQTVQAEKFGELLASMDEAVDSTLRELYETGDLEHFLTERGWTAAEAMPKKRDGVSFDMPFRLQGVKARDLEEAIC